MSMKIYTIISVHVFKNTQKKFQFLSLCYPVSIHRSSQKNVSQIGPQPFDRLQPTYLYINLACLSVCLYPINVKTAKPIGPNFLWDIT